MRPHRVLVLVILLSIAQIAEAAVVRDGSSFDRAILVEGDYARSVDWEWNYLRNKLGLRGPPKEHSLTQHRGRTYDVFVFPSGRAVYFDVRKTDI
jgi:hypothetical protein